MTSRSVANPDTRFCERYESAAISDWADQAVGGAGSTPSRKIEERPASVLALRCSGEGHVAFRGPSRRPGVAVNDHSHWNAYDRRDGLRHGSGALKSRAPLLPFRCQEQQRSSALRNQLEVPDGSMFT